MPPVVLIQAAPLSPDINGFLYTPSEPVRFFVQDLNAIPINFVANLSMFIQGS